MMPLKYVEYDQIGIKNKNKNILVSYIYRSSKAVHNSVINELRDILTKRNEKKKN